MDQTEDAMKLEDVLDFLKRLAKNNNRTWFEKNKPEYIGLKKQFEEFIGTLLINMAKFDLALRGLEARRVIFRIYRDVRFSKDKRPYKTNMGAGFSPVGKGLGRPGYYLHIEPGGKSFVAGGLYMPDAERLAKVRQEIDYNAGRLSRVLKTPSFRRLFDGFWDEDKLKTAPKGYPRDHPNIEWLKLKSFIVEHSYSDKEVVSPTFGRKVTEHFRALKPLNDFLSEALD